MLYQRTPLPPDIDYFLDGALGEEEISALCHNAITLLGDRKTVMSIVDADKDNPRRSFLRNRRDRALDLDNYAHQLVSDLATHEQAAFYASGMLREPLKLHGLAIWLCSWNHEDETVGGCGKPYRRWNVYHDKNYDPTPRVRRHLYSPRAIRRYVKAEDESLPYARRLAESLRRLPVGRPAEAQLIIDLLNEQRSAYRETLAAARAKFEAGLYRDLRKVPRPAVLTKAARKAITRAATFAAGVIGAAQISAFAHGEPILLKGKNVALELTTRGDIARLGHGGLTINLCTTEGERLSGLCVYFDKTPVLDQVAAIALHLQAGCESDLIDTGNLYAVTPLGAANPIVAARISKSRTEVSTEPRRMNDQDRKQAAQERYKADTLRIYFDAVTDRVWGRDKKQLQPFNDAIVAQGEALARKTLEAA